MKETYVKNFQGGIIYRLWNAVKWCFGYSDYQLLLHQAAENINTLQVSFKDFLGNPLGSNGAHFITGKLLPILDEEGKVKTLRDGSLHFENVWDAHCVEESEGLLKGDKGEVIYKGQGESPEAYSPFIDTHGNELSLAGKFKENGIQLARISGYCTDYCAGEAAKDALFMGTRVLFDMTASAGVTAETTEQKVKEILLLGGVVYANDGKVYFLDHHSTAQDLVRAVKESPLKESSSEERQLGTINRPDAEKNILDTKMNQVKRILTLSDGKTTSQEFNSQALDALVKKIVAQHVVDIRSS